MGARGMAIGWVALAGLFGCGESWVEEQVGDLRVLSLDAMSGPGGRLRVKVPVAEGESAMLFTVDAEDAHMGVFLSAVSPSGERVYDLDTEWDSERYKTGARYASDVVSLNWPILASDVGLEPGDWKVEVGLVDNEFTYRRSVDAAIDVLLKRDPDFTGGTLPVRVVYAGAMQTDPEVRGAMVDALDRWSDIYAAFGVTLALSEGAWPEDDLAQPGQGTDDAYLEIARDTPVGALTLVVVSSLRDSPDVFGVSGGIPGPLVPTARSVVAVAAQLHAGANLEFSSGEVEILAETMAHEVGHFLGLFHPVERTWDAWDAIDDTDECADQSACITALGDNMMFPFPVCDGQTCRSQDQLTDDQLDAMNRYVGVR